MEAYIFLPIYNVNVDDNIINQDFSGFRIITNDVFLSEYEKLVKNVISNEFLNELKCDIRKPNHGEFIHKRIS